MKYLSIILLVFCLSSCDKSKNELPPEYSFLIGKWRCVNCNNETNVIIEKNKLTVNSYEDRSITASYKKVKVVNADYMSTDIIYLIQKSSTQETFISIKHNVKDSFTLIVNSNYRSYYDLVKTW